MQEDIDNLPANVTKEIKDIDDQLSSIASTGFEDTSIAKLNVDSKITNLDIFLAWFKTLPSDVDEILKIGENIKCVIRLACEGSTADPQTLSPWVYQFVKTLLDEKPIIDNEKIQQLIPVLLTRKNLDKNGSLSYYWESPYIELFPRFYIENIRKDRSTRFSILRKYRAIERVRETLISGEYEAIDKAKEALNKLIKTELDKKEKIARRKSLEEQREREKELKKQEAEQKKLEKEKMQEQKRLEAEAKKLLKEQERERERELKEAKKREREIKESEEERLKRMAAQSKTTSQSGFNILLKWLKPDNEIKIETVEPNRIEEQLDEDVTYYVKKIGTEKKFGDLKKKYLKVISELSNVNNIYKKTSFLDCDSKNKEEVLNELENFIITTYKEQREKWNLYIKTVSSPLFVSNTNIEEEVEENLKQKVINYLYLDETLPDKDNASVYYMYDSAWKRPFMKLIINKRAKNATGLKPVVQESIDYSADTDEEWFEQCDFDNVDDECDDSSSEESEELEEGDDWLVPDGEIDKYNVLNNKLSNCAVIYSNLGWEWTLDGVSIIAYKNGDNCGGFYGFNKININPLELVIQDKKFTIAARQELELIDYCHGKTCSRDKLIEELKTLELLSMAPKAAINRCINKNFIRQKSKNKSTWILSQEGLETRQNLLIDTK